MDIIKVMQAERDRIHTALKELNVKQEELGDQITALRQELKAIEAYESAKTGKKKVTRTRGTSVTAQIIDIVKKSPSTRAQIIEALNGKGNKSVEQSISNALSNLKKKNTLSAKDGVYTHVA
jgi:outer membrane murein-binding lipoprotein Lpp